MADDFNFYRLFGVFDDGGTIAEGQMLEAEDLPERIAYWLRKNSTLRTIQIVKVTKKAGKND